MGKGLDEEMVSFQHSLERNSNFFGGGNLDIHELEKELVFLPTLQ